MLSYAATSPVPTQPLPAPLAALVAAGQNVIGNLPPVTVAPVITNDRAEFNLRSQSQAKYSRVEKTFADELDAPKAELGYTPPFGFAPFFAQLIAQTQGNAVDVESLYQQALQRSTPRNEDIIGLFDLPRSELLTFNAPPYESASQAIVEKQMAERQNVAAPTGYAYRAYSMALNLAN